MDIFGNKIKQLHSSFKVTESFIDFKGRRLVDVKDPISGYDAVTKQYLEKECITKPEYTNLLTQFSNYYNKKEIEKAFSEYFTKTDLQTYITQINNLENKISDKQIIGFTFLTGNEQKMHNFEYDFRLKRIVVVGMNINKNLKYDDFDITVSVADKLYEVNNSNQSIIVHKSNFLTVRLKDTVKTVPVRVKLIIFGEIIDEEENLEL